MPTSTPSDEEPVPVNSSATGMLRKRLPTSVAFSFGVFPEITPGSESSNAGVKSTFSCMIESTPKLGSGTIVGSAKSTSGLTMPVVRATLRIRSTSERGAGADASKSTALLPLISDTISAKGTAPAILASSN